MSISFGLDWWALGAVVFSAVFLFGTWAAYPVSTAAVRRTFWQKAVATFIILYGIGTGIGAAGSTHSSSEALATSTDLATYFGLQSGKAYPLILSGTQGSGTIGKAQTRGGRFGSSLVELRPTSTVSVGFQKGESWWQLTLPTNTVEYRRGTEKPMVTIWLNDTPLDTKPSYQNSTYWMQTWSKCSWEYHNFWFVCNRKLEKRELVVDDNTRRAGLSNVVSKYFNSALINLTDEQHAALFPH